MILSSLSPEEFTLALLAFVGLLGLGRGLFRLQANSAADGIVLLDGNRDAIAELTLNLKAPLSPSEMCELHSHENLYSLKMAVDSEMSAGYTVQNEGKSSSQLFSEYYRSRFDAEVPSDLLELFLSLTEEE